ncbi:hypothetical protein IL306_004235 [Fusarium sp. DS 682]|nr:hypothetical protein IL306_004235 [Fusarium sp. DS 682]
MSPNRVHINDPNFYHKVYFTGTKFLKEPAMFKFAGELDALSFIMDPAAHKVRRGIVNPMFSPRAIKDFSPLALQIIKAALKKIGDSYETGQPVNLKRLESNFAMDIIMKLCFGKDMNCTKGKEGTEALVDSMVALPHSFSLIKHFPMLGKIMQSFPTHVLTYIIPGFVEFRNQCAQWANEVRERHQNGVYTDETGRQTVFDAILDAEPSRSTKGLVDEAFSLVIGGTETTVTTITYGVWCILKNPEVEKKMLEELRTVETNSDGLFVIFSACCALSTSVPMLMAFRFLSGVAGVAVITCGSGSIADMMPAEQRGRAISLWSLGPLAGPVVGPVCAGFLIEAKGWRWVFWIITIVSGVAVPASFFILRESYAPVLLERKAKRLRKEIGNQLYQARTKKKGTTRELFIGAIIRPTRMFCLSFIVMAMCIYLAVVYGIFYILLTAFTFVYKDAYGFNSIGAGLSFIPGGIGNILGLAYVGVLSDNLIKRRKAQGLEHQPEQRLHPIISVPTGLAMALGLICYGWTADKQIHWIAPMIGTGIVGFGMLGIFMSVQTYLVDMYTTYAASVTAANTVLRSVLGALLPLCGLQLYDGMGLGWGNTLLGFDCAFPCTISVAVLSIWWENSTKS